MSQLLTQPRPISAPDSMDLSASILTTPWAMSTHRVQALAEASLQGFANTRRPSAPRMSRTGRVSVIPIHGVLTQRAGLLSALGIGISTAEISAALQVSLLDPSVAAIVLDIDSDGGEVYGIAELAEQLLTARRQKPVVAIANSLAASAAYWLAASCTEVYATPGGEVGGIGVVSSHQDTSGALDQAGIGVTLIGAGKYKTEGNPYGPLDPEARGFMQSRVDRYAAAFVGAVARGRNTSQAAVRGGYGQGRVLGANQAKAEGMVDGVCTIDELVRDLAGGARKPGGAGASARLKAAVALQAVTQADN